MGHQGISELANGHLLAADPEEIRSRIACQSLGNRNVAGNMIDSTGKTHREAKRAAARRYYKAWVCCVRLILLCSLPYRTWLWLYRWRHVTEKEVAAYRRRASRENDRRYYVTHIEYFRAYAKLYREANPAATRARDKRYWESHRERRLTQKKAYREANSEEIKLHRKANREQIAAYAKAYREANREKIAVQRSLYRQANVERIRKQRGLRRNRLATRIYEEANAWVESHPEEMSQCPL